MDFHRVLPTKNMQTGVWLISHSKLPVGVNVNVDVCLYMSTVLNWPLIQSDPGFTPFVCTMDRGMYGTLCAFTGY